MDRTPLTISSPPRSTSSSRSNARPAYLRPQQGRRTSAQTSEGAEQRPPDALLALLPPSLPPSPANALPCQPSPASPFPAPVDVQQQEGLADALKLELHGSREGGAHHTRCQPARGDGRLGIGRLRGGAGRRRAGVQPCSATQRCQVAYRWPAREEQADRQAGECDKRDSRRQPDSRSDQADQIMAHACTCPLVHLGQQHKEAVSMAVNDPGAAAVRSQPPIGSRCFQLSLGPPAAQQQAAVGQPRAGQGGIKAASRAAVSCPDSSLLTQAEWREGACSRWQAHAGR